MLPEEFIADNRVLLAAMLAATFIAAVAIIVVYFSKLWSRYEEMEEHPAPEYQQPSIAHIYKTKRSKKDTFTLWFGHISINGYDHTFVAVWKEGRITLQIDPGRWGEILEKTGLRPEDYEYAEAKIRSWVEREVEKTLLKPGS